VPASDQPRDFGTQDVVICALKAHQAWHECKRFSPLLGADTSVVTATNGIPWWYFYGPADHWRAITWNRWITAGGSGMLSAQGAPLAASWMRLARSCPRASWYTMSSSASPFGEPNGSLSSCVQALSQAFVQAGFEAPVRDNIRWNVWLKLWGNACFNPISLLTGATLDQITGEPGLRSICTSVMKECRLVANALRIEIPEAVIVRRLDVAGLATGHKMSMLQDLESDRSIEIDALVRAVHELGRLTQVSTPTEDILLALAQERGRQAGIYR